jgi:threonine/homoserine/homoserine lactone efflux protein
MFWQGVILGLSLSFMIGPLLFAIVQAALAQGFRAGLAVAVGIWLSDVLFMSVVMSSLTRLQSLTDWPGFRLWAGLAGGLILVGFGLRGLFTHRKPVLEQPIFSAKKRGYLTWATRGFLLNTINPFTVFFWLGIAGAVLLPKGWNQAQTFTFFSGMLGILVFTDTLKAYGAKQLRRFLTPEHIRQVQWFLAALLLVFGVVLLFRSI